MKERKILGVIADDFTGASDAASFLLKGGARVIMCNEVPDTLEGEFDALVIALKIRSVPPEKAIEQVKKALSFLQNNGCEQFYYKYCSTFDSTPKGNIGVVMDCLMEILQVPYSILCPSLPVNGRTVKNGILYVNGTPLDQSSMKNHPLNPMWDSYIPNLMKPQSKYPCEVISSQDMKEETVLQLVEQHQGHPFYMVPDYVNNSDGKLIARLFKNVVLLSGGSGLLEYLADGTYKTPCLSKSSPHKTILLCGSCSQATKKQVYAYRDSGGTIIPIDSGKLLNHTIDAQSIFGTIQKETSPVLVYSDAIDHDMNELKESDNFLRASQMMESFMSDLSALALNDGYDRIVVAGGETSGAVIKKLGFESFYIEKNVDPGVPVLRPLGKDRITVILKSGNFGSEDFFNKASYI